MEASLRILRLMITEDKVDLTCVLQHVGYLIKVATLAQNFKWDQVLKYDQEYRKSQAELAFPWGADNSFLMQVYLKSSPQEYFGVPKSNQMSRRQQQTANKPHPPPP